MAVLVVAIELLVISSIRNRYMDTPFLRAAFQVIVGGVCNDVPAPNSQHGWVLSNGQFSPLNDPNAGPGGTQPTGISENGRFVAGMYLDAGCMLHGFTATLTP